MPSRKIILEKDKNENDNIKGSDNIFLYKNDTYKKYNGFPEVSIELNIYRKQIAWFIGPIGGEIKEEKWQE